MLAQAHDAEGSMRKTLVAVVAVVALGGAACSSNGGGSSGSPSSGGTASASGGCTTANATDLTKDDPFTLTIVDFAFKPDCFEAASAASITIKNTGTVPHTFTIDGTGIDVTIGAGDTFNGESAHLAPGTYPFHCKIHPQMTGTVIVT